MSAYNVRVQATGPAISSLATNVTPSGTAGYWTCQIVGWGLNALGQTYGALENVDARPLRIVIEVALLNVLALAMSHLLRSFVRRRGYESMRLLALLPRVLLASVLLGLPLAGLMHFMDVATL